MQNVCLVGVGPHAKRIYLNYFKTHKVNLALVVDLESNKDDLKKYLYENGFKSTKFFSLDDKYKDYERLPKDAFNDLAKICNDVNITHIIISTEPKAHNMYIEFALKNNIEVLTDKPITVSKNMTSINSLNKVRKEYYNILKLSKKSKANCYVMCQRQYHKGYIYVKELLNDVVSKYKIPITYIDIYHCDGAWEMAHDMEKENHPYKYGYGKLFHSGYHFIDLLSDYLKINNNNLIGAKEIVKGDVVANTFTPNDEINVFNIEDYKRIFKNQDIPSYYYENNNPKFNKYGEKNYYGLLRFRNKYNTTVTNVNLNLLHYGFSRRGWINTKDFYKTNGRIRHERISIQVGTLMNIQIHSYQSKEIKDGNNLVDEESTGGLEHFDIDIYRNSDIIGGKSFERIKLGDLYSNKDKETVLGENKLGYNEKSREEFLNKFFSSRCNKGKIEDQALTIEILYSCALQNIKNEENKRHNIKFNIDEFSQNIGFLRKYSTNNAKEDESEEIKYYEKYYDKYTYMTYMNYINKKKEYEIYLVVENNKKLASCLLYKRYKNKCIAQLYFKILYFICSRHNLNMIISLQKKHKINTKKVLK